MAIDWGSVDGISLTVSVVALLLACYATLQNSRLARRQIRQLDEEQAQRGKADVRVRLLDVGHSERFFISNEGPGAAREICFSVDVDQNGGYPLIPAERDEKLPIAVLEVGDEVALDASLTDDTGTTFPCTWSWRNEDGTSEERSRKVSLT